MRFTANKCADFHQLLDWLRTAQGLQPGLRAKRQAPECSFVRTLGFMGLPDGPSSLVLRPATGPGGWPQVFSEALQAVGPLGKMRLKRWGVIWSPLSSRVKAWAGAFPG